MNRTRLPILSLLFGVLATTSAHAGLKSIMLYNPWAADSTVALGLPMGQGVSVVSYYPVSYSKGSDSALMHAVPGTPWLGWTAPDSASIPSGLTFIRDDWSSYDTSGLGGQEAFTFASYWATSDTVWLIPNPTPGGPPTISTVRPSNSRSSCGTPGRGKHPPHPISRSKVPRGPPCIRSRGNPDGTPDTPSV